MKLLEGELADKEGRDAAFMLVELGDMADRAGQPESAATWYRKAADAEPSLQTPARRLINLELRGLPGTLRSLSDDLADMRRTRPDVALRGYRELVRALGADRMSSASERDARIARTAVSQAVVEIVGLLSESGGAMDIESIGIAREAAPAPYAELEAALSPGASVPVDGFWMSSLENRNVLARAKLAQGDRAQAAGEPKLAEACWLAGLGFAPHYEEYSRRELRGAPLVRLDLATRLLDQWAAAPAESVPPARFERLIDEIFDSKGMAYQAQDLESIQRHHQVLGLVYAAHGTWTSHAYGHNAIFQLQHVLDIAKRREREVGYQPLPLIRATLARGMDLIGAARQAAAMHLEASQAFLDVDQLDSAGTELSRAAGYWTDHGQNPPEALASTREVLAQRRAVRRISGPGARVDSSYEAIATRWSGSRPGALTQDFFERQRFKVLSDLASLDVPPERRRVLSEGLAETFTRSPTPLLVGAADLIRLERVQSQALKSIGVTAPPPVVQRIPTPARGAIFLGSPATRKGTSVVPSRDLGLALRLQALQDADSTLRRPGSRVVLRGDSIVVQTPDATAKERQRVQRQVRKIAPGRIQVVPR